jgi:DNA recombination protein RmuC
MSEILLIVAIVLLIALIILQFVFKPKAIEADNSLGQKMDLLEKSLQKIETNIKDDFRINREENAKIARDNRDELSNALKEINKTLSEKVETLISKIDEHNKANREETTKSIKELNESNVLQLDKINNQTKEDNKQMREDLKKALADFSTIFKENVESFNNVQREKFGQLDEKQNKLIEGTEKKLEEMRVMVDEKLQKTLNERLGQSFELVGKQLENVQKGLGEMQTLAQDVGGLKKVLSNVKMRGGIGEVQLAMLLEQVLAPDQYEANKKTKASSNDLVEFAIKLPGKDDHNTPVWLPVDAKFPKDVYEQLQTAYDIGDLQQIEVAQKALEATIKKMAKDIHDKYIDPPNTTDFGIMFLPFEGIYAEVVRKASLLEDLQRNYKIIVTGPTTLAAILNSLQMGFKTLAIQKRSSEVWTILGAVKKEFENFGGLMQKAQKNIQTGLDQLDDVMGKRTKAIQRKLKSVESLGEAETKLILPDVTDNDVDNDDDEA